MTNPSNAGGSEGKEPSSLVPAAAATALQPAPAGTIPNQGNASNRPDSQAQPNYLEDAPLARQLSRLAAIHGRSVPAFRFGMTTQTDAGVPLENLSRHERAMELWQAHFPQGEVRQVVITEVKRTEFPLLWFSEDDSQVLIIRGPLA
ncbi:MAG: hypothetical protein RLZZ344_1199, partial [Pseudomonadota bacterium]